MTGDEKVCRVGDVSGLWVSLAGSLLLMADNIIVTERERNILKCA